ncbi:MAG: hypothetical protein JW973_18070 [Bacteroidales bacterium]|nr:hypothetical protein [Bacteroidales bacterium]
MKKTLIAFAIAVVLLAGCTGKAAKKEAARAQEAAEIERIDSVTNEISNIKSQIDSSAKVVDELMNDL